MTPLCSFPLAVHDGSPLHGTVAFFSRRSQRKSTTWHRCVRFFSRRLRQKSTTWHRRVRFTGIFDLMFRERASVKLSQLVVPFIPKQERQLVCLARCSFPTEVRTAAM